MVQFILMKATVRGLISGGFKSFTLDVNFFFSLFSSPMASDDVLLLSQFFKAGYKSGLTFYVGVHTSNIMRRACMDPMFVFFESPIVKEHLC